VNRRHRKNRRPEIEIRHTKWTSKEHRCPGKAKTLARGEEQVPPPTAHRVQVTYLIISGAGTAPEVTNGDQVETDATIAEDRHGDSIRIEALPDAQIHNPNLTRIVLKGGGMAVDSAPPRHPQCRNGRRRRRGADGIDSGSESPLCRLLSTVAGTGGQDQTLHWPTLFMSGPGAPKDAFRKANS